MPGSDGLCRLDQRRKLRGQRAMHLPRGTTAGLAKHDMQVTVLVNGLEVVGQHLGKFTARASVIASRGSIFSKHCRIGVGLVAIDEQVDEIARQLFGDGPAFALLEGKRGRRLGRSGPGVSRCRWRRRAGLRAEGTSQQAGEHSQSRYAIKMLFNLLINSFPLRVVPLSDANPLSAG